jgi:hypothetical protein
MRRTFATLSTLALACCTATAVLAGDADPAKPVLPNLDAPLDAHDAAGFETYFYFHKQAVGYPTALADIRECDSYSAALQPMMALPAFVPIGGAPRPDETTRKALVNVWFAWGPVGLGIVAIAMDDVRAGAQRANIRRCMGFRGYQRYGTSRSAWKELSKDGDEQFEAKLALIASGPLPQSKALTP